MLGIVGGGSEELSVATTLGKALRAAVLDVVLEQVILVGCFVPVVLATVPPVNRPKGFVQLHSDVLFHAHRQLAPGRPKGTSIAALPFAPAVEISTPPGALVSSTRAPAGSPVRKTRNPINTPAKAVCSSY